MHEKIDAAKTSELLQATVDVEALEEAKTTPSTGLPLSALHVLDVEEEDEEEHARDRGGPHMQSEPEVVDVEAPTPMTPMPMHGSHKGQNEATTLPATVDADDGAASTEPRSKSVAQAVAEAVDAVEAAEAAEAEVEAIMKEEVLRRALLDPEGEARRRRVLARKSQSGRRRWNFAGRAARARSGDDRYREHEVDLECRRKLAFRARGRFRGPVEDRGDERQNGNMDKQREALKVQLAGPSVPALQERKRTRGERSPQANRSRRGRGCREEKPKRFRLPPLDFPELPILIADGDDHVVIPEARAGNLPAVIQIDRECRQARASELEKMRGDLAMELEVVQKERADAARELRQSCVVEAEAVERLRQALTAAFGSVDD
ncbi:unnamed protein product [Symbiodinium sp. CCMP2592]|nr:unnamed protein product [Symbiodinium sp. CCMP2592]